jgi:hypothetical protein
MAEQPTKRQVAEEIKKSSQRLSEQASELAKKAAPLGDKGLVEKIQKVQQGATEVSKHIEERTNPKNG